MPNARPDDRATHLRLLVRVLQTVLREDTYASVGDVAEALKIRCARLRIPYDGGLVSAAIEQLEQGGRTPIVDTRDRPTPAPAQEAPADLDRATAARLLAELRVRVRSVPRVRELTPDEIGARAHDTDRARAMRVVLEAIAETNARIDALEREEVE
jgi:hypothetical protein